MNIGIDARLIAQTGVGVYIRNLLQELAPIVDKNISFFIYIRPEDRSELPDMPKNFTIRTSNARWHTLTEQTLFLAQLLKDKLDLMHFCYFSFPILYHGKFVITIHDLIPFKYPTGKASTKSSSLYAIKHFFYKRVLAHGLTRAQKIFVPSNAVKNDIKKYFPTINAANIIRTYEGLDMRFYNIVPKPLPISFKKPYFLYIGNFYPHKNVPFLINAFDKAHINAQLVLCGPSDYFADRIDNYMRLHAIKDKVIRLSGTSIAERAWLYAHAEALVHPSKEEGFGLPLLEAAYFGCPVIASDIPVFREIVPEVQFFNVNEPDLLITILKNFLKETTHLKSGTIDKKFSFKEMAKDTYAQYLACL